MDAVGIKTLKNRLSEFVRRATRGETILVTDRDRVVAELVPPRQSRAAELADALLADAVRQGWLTPPVSGPDQVPPRRPVMKVAEVLRGLDADRGER